MKTGEYNMSSTSELQAPFCFKTLRLLQTCHKQQLILKLHPSAQHVKLIYARCLQAEHVNEVHLLLEDNWHTMAAQDLLYLAHLAHLAHRHRSSLSCNKKRNHRRPTHTARLTLGRHLQVTGPTQRVSV